MCETESGAEDTWYQKSYALEQKKLKTCERAKRQTLEETLKVQGKS